MNVTKTKLENIIKEEIYALLGEKQALKTSYQKRETERKRQREEMLKSRKLGYMANLEEDNPYHDPETGHWTSKDEAGCASTYFKDKKRQRMAGGSPKSLKNRDESGRGRRYTGSGKFRCRDNSEKVSEDILEPKGQRDSVTIKKSALQRLIQDELLRTVSRFIDYQQEDDELDESMTKERLVATCRKYGLKSFKDFLLMMNSIESASKGNLLKKQKS